MAKTKAKNLNKDVALSTYTRLLTDFRNNSEKYLDLAGVLIVVISTDGKVVFINQRGCKILGFNREEILGKNWFENFIPDSIKTETLRIFNELITGEIAPAEYFENPVKIKDGNEKIILWHNTVLMDKNKKIIGTISSGDDITELKSLQKGLKEKVADLEKLNKILVDRETEVGRLRSEIEKLKGERWTEENEKQ